MKWMQKIWNRYETTTPSRTHDIGRSTGDGDRPIGMAGKTLREQARFLEENHDLVNGILTVLVNNTVGPEGITVEPLPRNADGSVNRDLADELSLLYDDWSRHPEVTGEYTRPAMERLLARSLYRDGEVFVQHLSGRVPFLQHRTQVPYSVEMLEADMVPMDHPDNVQHNNFQGVIKNNWGQPIAYQVYMRHPGSIKAWDTQLKEVKADSMLHAKLVSRVGQTRGVSLFASVLKRLNDLRMYEESEQVAARMAACLGLYIKRGNPDLYVPGNEEEGDDRLFEMAPGIIYDNLLPGEEIGDISPNRPSQLLQPFRDSMLKAVSAGVKANYSTVSKDYSGTYSSQRQELSDSYVNYGTLQADFVNQICRPMWEQFLASALMAKLIRVPDSLDERTLYDATFRGPVQPWIDPAKEASANLIQVRAGFKSLSQVIRERGENPRRVLAEIQREREEAEEMGIELSSFASTDDTNMGGTGDDSGQSQGLRTQGNKDDDSGSGSASGRAVRLR
jgi:lambda family phage portal protein